MSKLLVMEGITKSFYGVKVLKSVDFELDRGEVHVLLGENGAGKSTLMKILCGAYTLDSGSITIDGSRIDLAGYDPKRAEDLGVVTVYQNFHLIPHLSVSENLSLGRFTHRRGLIRWKEVHEHARQVLDRIDFPVDPRTRVRELPVSQKQMLEIAIALSKNAKILIMDEPTAALSRKETENLFRTIADIKSTGVGIIYISHKLEEVKQVGDRITVLRDGLSISTLPTRDADLNSIIALMIGKDLTRTRRDSTTAGNSAAFEARSIVNRNLARPISFSVRKGEILGVTGLVGSGKTELARALFGIDRLSGGGLLLDGRAVQIDSPKRAVSQGIGYLSEDRDTDGLCLNMGVKENVSLVLLSKLRTLFFSVAAERRTVEELVTSIGLKIAGLSQQVKYLSGGNKQKVVFGKWLTAKCRLLILDEPTMGIDVGARGDIYGLIRRFVEQKDRAVIFISSDVDEILEVSDRILVMSGGQIAAELDSGTATKQEIMRHSTRIAQGAE
ncbi:MAG TPA: sugar ABC transporter ATP-binding protein [Spirochaetia bacterium]|nr:sugar ABC transporter ATP-binding protein [Spirochaetia bacterium]